MPPPFSPSILPTTISALSKIKVHLHIFLAELSIMRSNFTNAQAELGLAISTSRLSLSNNYSNNKSNLGLWDQFSPRITLGKGLLFQARGKDIAALECFDTVIQLVEDRNQVAKSSIVGSGLNKLEYGLEELSILAKCSILMIKLGQGVKIRMAGTESTSNLNSMSMDTTSNGSINRRKSTATPSTTEELYLSDLALEIVRFTSPTPTTTNSLSSSTNSKSNQVKLQPTSMTLLHCLIQALTRGEIIKSKLNLSKALTILTDTGANHAKSLVLALLANFFLLTADLEVSFFLFHSLLSNFLANEIDLIELRK